MKGKWVKKKEEEEEEETKTKECPGGGSGGGRGLRGPIDGSGTAEEDEAGPMVLDGGHGSEGMAAPGLQGAHRCLPASFIHHTVCWRWHLPASLIAPAAAIKLIDLFVGCLIDCRLVPPSPSACCQSIKRSIRQSINDQSINDNDFLLRFVSSSRAYICDTKHTFSIYQQFFFICKHIFN